MKRFFPLTFFLVLQVIIGVCMLAAWFVTPGVFAQEQQQGGALDPDRNSNRNKQPAGATLLPLGGADDNGAISYDAGDRTDWYAVQVKQDGELLVTVQNRIDGDLDMEVYGPDRTTTLAKSVTPETGNEKVLFSVKAENRYYIKVYAAQPGDVGDYAITNTFYEKDRMPPQLILNRTETQWTTTDDSVVVLGTVRDNVTIAAIQINNIDILSSTTLLNMPSGEARSIWYTIPALSLGDNIIKIDAQDASGNQMPSVTLIVTRQAPPSALTPAPESTPQEPESPTENPAPVIEISAPENKARFRPTQDIVLRGTVRDNEEVSWLWVNGQEIADDPWAGTQRLGSDDVHFAYLLEAAEYGAHEITIIAEDNLGMQRQTTVTVYRDAPPRITIESPLEGTVVRDDTLRIRGVVEDDWYIARITVNGVDVTVNGANGADALIADPAEKGAQQEFSYIVPDLQYGRNVVRIEAEDDIGNLTTELFEIERQELPPEIQITTPRHQETISQSTVLVQGVVSDPDGIAVLTIQGEPADVSDSGEFRHQVTEIPYGASTLEVMATDTRGKSTRVLVEFTRVDQEPPVITVLKPEHARMNTKEDVTEIRLEISDEDQVAYIEINGKEEAGTSFPGGKKSLTRVIGNLHDGQNLIEVLARDVNENTARKVITIYKIPPPAILISGITLKGLQTTDETMLVTGSIRTDDAVASVNINGVTVTVDAEQNNAFSYQAEQLKVGPNSVDIVAIDRLGGQTRKSFIITRIDRVEPEISIAMLEGERTTNQKMVLVNVTVSDNDQIALVEINGKERDGTDMPIDGPGQKRSFRYAVENLEDGENVIRVVAQDVSGNSAETSIQVYKVPPPKIIIAQPESDVDTVADTLLIQGHVQAEAGVVSVNIAGKPVSVNTADNNSFSFPIQQLPLGKTQWNILAIDSFGSQDQTTITVTRREPDYQSGRDQSADGAARLRIDDTLHDLSIDYDGDRTDWFQVYLHMQGEWTVTIHNSLAGNLDLALYSPDAKTMLGESKSSDTGDKTLTVNIEQSGVYYAKVTAQGVGDRGQYAIVNQFSEADITPPVLTIVQPEEEDIQIDLGPVTIAGSVQDRSAIKELGIVGEAYMVVEDVEFNREETVADFTYTIVKGLQPGENVLTLRAIDEAGNISEETRYVRVSAIPPESTDVPNDPDVLDQYLQQLRPGNVYAVIIGIADYDTVRDLRFAANDAQEFYNLLIDPNYGRVPEEHIRRLLNEQATKQNIEEAIGTWLPEQAGEDDTVFIFYAGHGETEEDVAYWVTHHADINNLKTTALSNNVLSEMLKRIKAKRMITFLDSCYSAATAGLRTLVLLEDIPFEKFSGEGRVIISASTGTQFSLELPEYRHGVFTYYLLEGLKGKADKNNNGVIDVDEIWDYVKYQVTETAKAAGNPQQPVFDARKITAGIPLTFNVPVLLERLPEEVLRPERPESFELFE